MPECLQKRVGLLLLLCQGRFSPRTRKALMGAEGARLFTLQDNRFLDVHRVGDSLTLYNSLFRRLLICIKSRFAGFALGYADCILYLMQYPYDPGTLPSSAN